MFAPSGVITVAEGELDAERGIDFMQGVEGAAGVLSLALSGMSTWGGVVNGGPSLELKFPEGLLGTPREMK